MKQRLLVEDNIQEINNTGLAYITKAMEEGNEGLNLNNTAIIFTEEEFCSIVYMTDLSSDVKTTFIKDIKKDKFNIFYDKLYTKLTDKYDFVLVIKY